MHNAKVRTGPKRQPFGTVRPTRIRAGAVRAYDKAPERRGAPNGLRTRTRVTARYNAAARVARSMACFCGCPKHIRDQNGYKIGCVECGHGPQNHEEEFRASARGNESASQKRDADFG